MLLRVMVVIFGHVKTMMVIFKVISSTRSVLMGRPLKLKQPMVLWHAITGCTKEEGKLALIVLPRSFLGREGWLTGQSWITTLNHVTEKLEATCIGTLESWRLTKDHSIFMDPSSVENTISTQKNL